MATTRALPDDAGTMGGRASRAPRTDGGALAGDGVGGGVGVGVAASVAVDGVGAFFAVAFFAVVFFAGAFFAVVFFAVVLLAVFLAGLSTGTADASEAFAFGCAAAERVRLGGAGGAGSSAASASTRERGERRLAMNPFSVSTGGGEGFPDGATTPTS